MENYELQKRSDDLQMMPLQQAREWYDAFVAFSKSIMKPDLDYGIIPGTPKPSLLKAGAEKLRLVYGLSAEQECIDKTIDLDRPFVDYTYRCTIRSKTGQILAQCEGSCNSLEPKFGYFWKALHELQEGTDISRLPSRTTGKKAVEFAFAVDKAETTGQYGKPKEYWDNWVTAIEAGRATLIKKKSKSGKDLDAWEMDDTVTQYRIPNPDVMGMKNTIMKMAQKRSFVGAMLLATGASEFYTQDIEDMEMNGRIASEEKPHLTEDAEVVIVDTKPASTPTDRKGEDGFALPGHWYAKLDKCKQPGDVTKLYNEHKLTIDANPELQKLFKETQQRLKKEAAHV